MGLIENTIRESMLDDPVIQYSASSDTNADASPCIKHRNTLSLFEASEEEDSILDSPLKGRCDNEMDHDNMINTEQKKLFVQKSVECEVERYLSQSISVDSKTGALQWWKFNANLFPYIAKVARKWLCVSATSTASERVFSDCGLAVTAKRSRLTGYALREQILVRRNLKCIHLADEDIIKSLTNA